MPTITLNEIRCIDPRGSRDDMMLTLVTDERNFGRIWGPERMREGNTINLLDRLDPIEYDDFARISLYEHDRVGRNDYFGTMSFMIPSEDRTDNFYFPGDLNARYRLNYSIDREPVTSPDHIIQPVSLTCNDAQGARDEVSLSLNHFMVLGPMHTMKTGWTVDFTEEQRLHFRANCQVKLVETYGQDWSRSFTIPPDYPIGPEDQQHVFNIGGRGVVGDARYTFVYRMLA